MKKTWYVAAAAVLLLAGIGMPVSIVAMLTGSPAVAGSGGAGPPVLDSIPPLMLDLYGRAARACAGLPWQILAAIGTTESGNGTSDAPGVHSGRNSAGAEGPMQFEPSTFAEYDRPVPPGGVDPPSPYDPVDAVFAAARMLCADGAGRPDRLGEAIYQYNHSAAYVAHVLAVAATYGYGAPLAGRSGALAVEYALSQVGTPYMWGGESPGVGFDCSGLAQAAYAAAGVPIPRVAQEQFYAGPPVPLGTPLRPGDLVFFGSGPTDVTHVGVVVDSAGVMVDAPHTGAEVRVEPFSPTVGARWGDDVFVGATRP